MLPLPTPAPDPSGRLNFVCPGCGLTLSAKRQDAGVSGPCPSCGAHVHAPDFQRPSLEEAGQPASKPANSPAQAATQRSPSRGLMASSNQRKGGIVADSAVDHQHTDRRETAKSLWIIAMFILAIAGMAAVAWFLKDWVRK